MRLKINIIIIILFIIYSCSLKDNKNIVVENVEKIVSKKNLILPKQKVTKKQKILKKIPKK